MPTFDGLLITRTTNPRAAARLQRFDELCNKLIDVDVDAFVAWLRVAIEELEEMLD